MMLRAAFSPSENRAISSQDLEFPPVRCHRRTVEPRPQDIRLFDGIAPIISLNFSLRISFLSRTNEKLDASVATELAVLGSQHGEPKQAEGFTPTCQRPWI